MGLFKSKYKTDSLRKNGYDYKTIGSYFITICTKDRIEYFGRISNGKMNLNEFGKIVYKNWKLISEIFPNILLDEFIIMPNHIHGILIIVGTLTNTETLHDTHVETLSKVETL